jgi:hypothetical protein
MAPSNYNSGTTYNIETISYAGTSNVNKVIEVDPLNLSMSSYDDILICMPIDYDESPGTYDDISLTYDGCTALVIPILSTLENIGFTALAPIITVGCPYDYDDYRYDYNDVAIDYDGCGNVITLIVDNTPNLDIAGIAADLRLGYVALPEPAILTFAGLRVVADSFVLSSETDIQTVIRVDGDIMIATSYIYYEGELFDPLGVTFNLHYHNRYTNKTSVSTFKKDASFNEVTRLNSGIYEYRENIKFFLQGKYSVVCSATIRDVL